MAETKIKYAASATITCSLASLASSTSFVAGQESGVIDNTANLYDDVLLSGKIKVGGSANNISANTNILVFVFAILDDAPTYPDVMDGTDSAETLTSVGVGAGFLKLACAIMVDTTTSDRDYPFGPVSVAQLFGGIMPPKWGVFVTHNTGQALNATGGNHFLKYTGITYTVA